MLVRLSSVLLALALLAVPSHAAAQVEMTVANGKVSIVASNATLRQILEQWQRITGARIVNLERVDNTALLTLQLSDVPQRAALATLLRGVGGYVLAQRPDTLEIDRILILPSGSVPAGESRLPTSSMAVGTFGSSGGSNIVARSGRFDDAAPEDQSDVERPGFVTSTSTVLNAPTGGVTEEENLKRYEKLAPPVQPDADATSLRVPANPFGVRTGTATPGVSTPAPRR